ncbi:MAG: GNAT family N-acetyltransferase [Paludibacteraceae bacterium]|nr:GNAT family N-acetyltransferase [Paludibacteraceae bacterium]MBQ6764854.1 GNAT family N-acetyltransferase [Paludibacteraceae bacterium]MBR4563050.1 GNAT family N-acetyltransferase [Paludibacteraceae bacterium]
MAKATDFEFVQLTAETQLLPFHCADEDLNHFLIEDAKNYTIDLMAVTYLLIDKNKKQIAAYYSLLNDKVAYDPQQKGFWNRINRHIHNNKRRRSYPSVKIGRLAVGDEYARSGLGSTILYYIKELYARGNRAGCRFLTVDAYANATDFYRKNDFEYFTMLDTLDTTRLMYFDLKPFKDSLEQGV